MNRTTLTKSLHTVTAVSNVALYLIRVGECAHDCESLAVRAALTMLGQPSDWPETDATFAACVAKVRAMRAGK